MAETAREILERQEEGYRKASASIAELHEAARPRVPDLPEDDAERDALLAEIDDPEGFTFRGPAEEDARAKELLRAEDLPPQLRAEVDRTEERIYAAGPDAGAEMRHLARLHAWMNQQYEETVPLGSVQYVKGVNLGARGGRTITKRVGRPPEVVRHTGEEVAALQAERDEQVAAEDQPLGTRQKDGSWTIEPSHVTASFAADPGKATSRWLALAEDERESLLRGETVTGVRLEDPAKGATR